MTGEEINFLANQNQGRDQIPRLEALADAVGTIVITADGDGYKELPEAEFSYGLDGNNTSDLAGPTPPPDPNYGDLYYDNATKVAKEAHLNGTTLKQEVVKLGFLDEKRFNSIVQPKKMIKPN